MYQTDTVDDEIHNLPKRTQTNRKRRVPSRLGVGKDEHDVAASTEGEDFSGTDGETDYIPPSKKQKAELILDHDLSHTDSETTNLHGEESHDRQSNASEKVSVECDFNSEFDELTQKSLENSDVLANQSDKNHQPAH